ncbi:MAG: metalloregulator ArsR/SmtB family transcription factor [Candidatus Doudnabacteria bacterium]
MVEYTISLDNIFHSLADETRRDILRRVAKKTLSVGQIAKHYGMTFAGISKHLKVLEKARLISKHKQGKEHIVSIHPIAFKNASEYISQYQKIWERRLDRLGALLEVETRKIKGRRKL